MRPIDVIEYHLERYDLPISMRRVMAAGIVDELGEHDYEIVRWIALRKSNGPSLDTRRVRPNDHRRSPCGENGDPDRSL